MKIISSSSLPTSNIRPTVARRISARYSPGGRGAFSASVSSTVKNASARQIILNSELSGEITTIPPKSVAWRGSIRTTAIAITSPRAATNGQADAARFARRLIESTASAVNTTTASGDESLRSPRYDIVISKKSHRFYSRHDAVEQQFRINPDGQRSEHEHARAEFLWSRDALLLIPVRTYCYNG